MAVEPKKERIKHLIYCCSYLPSIIFSQLVLSYIKLPYNVICSCKNLIFIYSKQLFLI